MPVAHDAVDGGVGLPQVASGRRGGVDVLEVSPPAEDAVLSGGQRNEDLLVRPKEQGLTLLCNHSDHVEGKSPDLDALAHHRRGRSVTQILHHVVAQDRHTPPASHLALVEEATDQNVEVVDLGVFGPGADDLEMGVPSEIPDLFARTLLGSDGQEPVAFVLECFGILHVQALAVVPHAAERLGSGANGENVGADALDDALDALLRAFAECHYRDDRRHPDDDTQGGEDRSEHVGPNGRHRHPEDLEDEHVRRSRRLRGPRHPAPHFPCCVPARRR